MTLAFQTFTNADFSAGGWRPGNNAGGSTLFKALGHPCAADKARKLVNALGGNEPVAIYDPFGEFTDFTAFYDTDAWTIAGVFVQKIEMVGTEIAGQRALPVTALNTADFRTLFVAAFDADRLVDQIRHLIDDKVNIVGFDHIRLPDDMLSNQRTYLAPINFATNFAFLRDGDGLHTRLVSANYWSSYGAKDPCLWLCLFDEHGARLAEWREPLPAANASVVLDSADIRQRFDLPAFAGSLFIHVIGAAGHDVVKYALDIYGDDAPVISCTHDANAWPADLYAGMPAPDTGETLTLWIQNSHPIPIAPGAIGVNLMGSQDIARLDREIAPFATYELDISTLLPDAAWPDQIEIQAGRHFVRPRYEVVGKQGARRIAHANVERTDLKPDARIPHLGEVMGKGYLMPLPVLPLEDFASTFLPTPMATCQSELPLSALLVDGGGVEIDRRYLGRLSRRDSQPTDIDSWLAECGQKMTSGYGHVELIYDFRDGGEADGWLHALGGYRQRASGHRAETIFGAHIYNTPIVFKDEPQSYAAAPPGLTTRIFLRLGTGRVDTLCHLIYPASLPWHERSETQLVLCDGEGREVARREVEIACGGSLHWRYHALFDAGERKAAGEHGYVLVRDATCRLFGFHGLVDGSRSFSLDHMFGF